MKEMSKNVSVPTISRFVLGFSKAIISELYPIAKSREILLTQKANNDG